MSRGMECGAAWDFVVLTIIKRFLRSIFFGITGKMLTIIDDEIENGKRGKFLVLAAENAEIDSKIVERMS